ncbi:hypothetical protein BDW74DRAFT_145797 [Aspergillus multicolor]|uniref:uncharacterized protein n=1 Tax=Aspergillus multicolor TaxID=41759 RepID=UPI003CCD95C0
MAISNEEAPPPRLHPAKPIPFELVQHVGIFFEENLHIEALRLLTNTLSTDPNTDIAVFTPSPQHLALAATFLIHPSTTARPKTDEEQETPHVALRMLLLVNNLVGPVNARFDLAFRFKHFEASRHGGRRYADGTSKKLVTNGERKIDLDKDINNELAQSASVWSRAEDFWHAVGWAFNCAVLHPARWKYWRIWLEFMCQVLEDDWVQRQRLKDQDPSHDDQVLKDSIIVNYITQSQAGFGRDRRIMRAIFADGGASAVNEFREVFRKELKLSRKKENKSKDLKKRSVAVNVDADEYGDFYAPTDHEEDGTSPGRESKRPRRAAAMAKNDAAIPTLNPNSDSTMPDPTLSSSLLGDTASLTLRQRLCHLLSTVSDSLPNIFMPLLDLYQLFVENIRHLPLPIYQAFVSPLALTHFTPAACSTLCELLLYGLRDSAAVDSNEQYLTQSKLETCFLPYAAASSSLSDNVKMSITLEALLVLLADQGMIEVTEETKQLTKKGIIRRAEKAQHETRKNHVARMSEDMEWAWLGESAERLNFLVEEVIPASARVTSTTIGS